MTCEKTPDPFLHSDYVNSWRGVASDVSGAMHWLGSLFTPSQSPLVAGLAADLKDWERNTTYAKDNPFPTGSVTAGETGENRWKCNVWVGDMLTWRGIPVPTTGLAPPPVSGSVWTTTNGYFPATGNEWANPNNQALQNLGWVNVSARQARANDVVAFSGDVGHVGFVTGNGTTFISALTDEIGSENILTFRDKFYPKQTPVYWRHVGK